MRSAGTTEPPGRRAPSRRAAALVAVGAAPVAAALALVLGGVVPGGSGSTGAARADLTPTGSVAVATGTVAGPVRSSVSGSVSRSVSDDHPSGAGPAVVAAHPSPTWTSGWIATLSGPVGWSAHPGGAVAGVLAARNPFGTPTVVAVVGRPDGDGWARVELPIRPDGSTGWIRWHDVRLGHTGYRVLVDLRADRLTVLDGRRRVLVAPAAVGTPATPTPTGSTFVWELVRPSNPGGAYGPAILGLGMYSDAYDTFNGGMAQIAIHGSDDPSSVGHPWSHGCIRLDNGLIVRLTELLPLGTPVEIDA